MLIALGLLAACASGASDPDPTAATIAGDDTSSGTTSTTPSTTASASADDDSTVCIPGQQIACPCPGGTDGAQACNDAGTGYEPCVCPGDTDPTTTTTTDTADADSTGTTDESDSNTNTCANDPVCDACVQCSFDNDCAAEYEACNNSPSCADALACVSQCGFTLACVQDCAPMDKGNEMPYATLANCAAAVCPQCL